jgi:endonuclease/exonuclease/phosphatase family metal-dependent hydrolase
MKHTRKKGKNQLFLILPWLAITLISLLISRSGSAQFLRPTLTLSPASTPVQASILRFTSAQTQTLTFTPTPSPLITVKVISYNILFGAGVDRKYDKLLPPEARNKNRLPEFLSFFNEAKPDILGVQEANKWDGGSPPIVQQTAEQLDVNYYLAEAPNDFNVVLFTKFEIVETENLSGKEGDPVFETMRALRATLLTPEEHFLNVFVVHFDPFSARTRLYQLDVIIDKLKPYTVQKTILLGDMNFCVGSLEFMTLERAGWKHIAVASSVDQIWISPAPNWAGKPFIPLGDFAWTLSDHLPVGTEISLYPTPAVIFTSTAYPQPDKVLSEENC